MKLILLFHRSALHIAVEKENQEIIKMLLNKKGIDINSKDEISTPKFIKF